MTQLLSLFNHAFGNQHKSGDLEQFAKNQNFISSIKKNLSDLVDAWIEARFFLILLMKFWFLANCSKSPLLCWFPKA